ncbi:MAG: periplasmic heavy metal sensor [Desulfuromonadales bacterium]|nr:periplasmic heavy metal sensor [Desulfuromonadales bacterium]
MTAFAGIAYANDSGWGGEHGGQEQQHNFRKIENKPGLADTQKAQAKAIFQGNREVFKPIIANLRAENKNIQALVHADAIDEAAIRAEKIKIAGIQANLNVNRAKIGVQFRAILASSQLEILKTLHPKKMYQGGDNTCPH